MPAIVRRVMCRVHRQETDGIEDERPEEHDSPLLAGRHRLGAGTGGPFGGSDRNRRHDVISSVPTAPLRDDDGFMGRSPGSRRTPERRQGLHLPGGMPVVLQATHSLPLRGQRWNRPYGLTILPDYPLDTGAPIQSDHPKGTAATCAMHKNICYNITIDFHPQILAICAAPGKVPC